MNLKHAVIAVLLLSVSSTIVSAYGFNPGYKTLYSAQNNNEVSNFISSYPYVVAYISNNPNFTVEQTLANIAEDQVVPGISFIHADTTSIGLQQLPDDLRLVSLPAFVLFKHGVPISIRYGYLTPEDLLRFIEMHFGSFITSAIQAAPHLFLSFGRNFSPRWWQNKWRPSWWQRPSGSWSSWKHSGHRRHRRPGSRRRRDRKGSGPVRRKRSPNQSRINWGKVRNRDANVRRQRSNRRSGSVNWGKVRRNDANVRRRLGSRKKSSRSGIVQGLSPMQQLQKQNRSQLAPAFQMKNQPTQTLNIQTLSKQSSGGPRVGKFKVGQGRGFRRR